ncbi:hypothetical protein KIPB_015786, partial [Kipferlia bialata]|eukprot:g15786.t1
MNAASDSYDGTLLCKVECNEGNALVGPRWFALMNGESLSPSTCVGMGTVSTMDVAVQ